MSPRAYRNAGRAPYSPIEKEACNSRWHPKSVLRILRDETYTGVLVQGKTRRPNWRNRINVPVPYDEWLRSVDAHEAIIERGVFEEVQSLLDAVAQCSQSHVPLYVQLYCGDCGARMTRTKVTTAGKSYVYYMCARHRKDTRACSTHTIREEVAINMVGLLAQRSDSSTYDTSNPLSLAVDKSGCIRMLE